MQITLGGQNFVKKIRPPPVYLALESNKFLDFKTIRFTGPTVIVMPESEIHRSRIPTHIGQSNNV